MKKYLILCFILTISLTSVNAQDKDSESQKCKLDSCSVTISDFAPQAGDFTAAMVFGRGAYLNGGLVVPSSYGNVSGAPAYDNTVDANSNSVTNMVGVEGRYYVTNRIALSLTGGAILRNTPTVLGIPAVVDGNGNVIIPAYNTVVAEENIDLHVAVGAQWLFNTKNKRLFPYLGLALPYDYARRSVFDQTPTDDGVTDLGPRHVEITAYGVEAVAGIDYYIAKDFYLGFDVKPVSYTYAVNVKTPGPGLFDLSAATDTVSFFAQFGFKVGFKL
jgi:outer membrane protein W